MRFIVARRHVAFFVLLGVLAIAGLNVSAQDNNNEDSPKVSQKEASMAKKLQEGTDVAAKLKLAEKFVKEFPESPIRHKVARYIAGQIGLVPDLAVQATMIEAYSKSFTKAGEADFIAQTQIDFYAKSNRYDESFKIGGEYLKRQPSDIFVALQLTINGTNLARSNNKKYTEQSRDIAQKAIDIIESGKKPADMTDADWTQAQGTWYAQFYQSLGFLYTADGLNFEAIASFDKATKLDPKDFNSWVMMGFVIDIGYQDLARKSQLAVGAEQAELRKQAENEIDRIIEIYARVIAMTDGVAAQANLNGQVRGELETYYKYRHGGKTDGLQALIDKYKTLK